MDSYCPDLYSHISSPPVSTHEIAGFKVRPGMFDINGAMALPNGINFTIQTHSGTSVELLLYHRGQAQPFAILPFPDSYRIGDVYSMIVFDLDIEDLEYAYRVDGPYQPSKGLASSCIF